METGCECRVQDGDFVSLPSFETSSKCSPTIGRDPRRIFAHNRSNSTVSVTATSHLRLATSARSKQLSGERTGSTMTRTGSLDFTEQMIQKRRATVTQSTVGSHSPALSNRSDKHRQSIRNLHQGLQQGIQGISDWTGKYGSIFARRSKTMISFARKGRSSSLLLKSINQFNYKLQLILLRNSEVIQRLLQFTSKNGMKNCNLKM